MTKSIFNPIRTIAATGALAAVALFAAQPAIADDHADDQAVEMTKGEKELAELLEGRVAGEPQTCIRQLPSDHVKAIDKTAYVYGRGNTIYVQRTSNPERIDDRDVLVSRRFSSTQLCRTDVTNTVDPMNGMFTGSIFFEDFIPYTRVDEDN
ncbi:MAG: hypothetical protein AAFY07_06810 [Pseudomonadota bacterium]